MLNTKKRPLMAAALLLTSLGITTSCIDSSYDLNKDIDMTISAGGEHLAIPVGYTEKITLDKIIELDEGDDLQIVDGEYHLLKKNNIDETNTSVGSDKAAKVSSRLKVEAPRLWSPDSPYLYQLHVYVKDKAGNIVDGYRRRIGIRSLEFKGKELSAARGYAEGGIYYSGKYRGGLYYT